jgi:type II secretory pathway component GspD/PulD (secretin)
MRATFHTLRSRCLIPAVLLLCAAPASTTPAPASEPPQTVKFVFENTTWREVFQWLTEMTGKPVIFVAAPTGRFSFHGPKDKQYTIDEVVDIINSRLEDCQRRETYYYLISRERSFTLVPANEKIDPVGGPPRIRPEDLAKHGKKELVQLVLLLTHLKADDIAPQVKKMMGPFGEAVPMTHTGVNQIILIDTVENLRAVRKMIEEVDKPQEPTRSK